MRLFIAINFEEEVKDKIEDVIDEVRIYSTQGRFTSREHMHLTLEFLGEIPINRVETIKSVMDRLKYKEFKMDIQDIGLFKRAGGDIYWIGIENNDSLLEVQYILHEGLIRESFKLESRPYKPHITIGRKVMMKEGFSLKELSQSIIGTGINVGKIDLMKSEHRNGKLVYSIIHTKRLE
ncbi:RNA 2',3'-cyclic phosphodiesterase [Tissierellaceae bacterium HCP3S3_D8]